MTDRRNIPTLVAAPLAEGFESEWDQVYGEVRRRALDELTTLGMSGSGLDYVGGMRLYLRVPFLLSLWVLDRDARREIATDLGLHIIAMKLFDDLVDADTELDRAELGLCLSLSQNATRRLYERGGPRILDVMEGEFGTICAGQLWTKREPARTLDEWLERAGVYGGGFLRCYGRLGALAGGVDEAMDAAGQFAHAFGLVITIADDLRDYDRKGERAGNLAHLLLAGAAHASDVERLVERFRRRAQSAARERPTAYDATPVVDHYCDDVVLRILPRYAHLTFNAR
jgi:hypothetical protein